MKDSGKVVKNNEGRIGLTKNNDSLVNGKIVVYWPDNKQPEKTLVSAENLTVIGFWDSSGEHRTETIIRNLQPVTRNK